MLEILIKSAFIFLKNISLKNNFYKKLFKTTYLRIFFKKNLSFKNIYNEMIKCLN
jgi:hypothetical protein